MYFKEEFRYFTEMHVIENKSSTLFQGHTSQGPMRQYIVLVHSLEKCGYSNPCV